MIKVKRNIHFKTLQNILENCKSQRSDWLEGVNNSFEFCCKSCL